MILKTGVSTRGIGPELLLALFICEQIYALTGTNMVITSLNDGRHSMKSKHWLGHAADLRTHNLPQRVDKQDIVRDIKKALGNSKDYDVILESIDTPNEHIHIEFDPKGQPG